MTGIFDRLSRTLRGLANDALDAASDPGRDARQIARDLDAQIQDAESALLDVRAEYTLMVSSKEKNEAEVARWLKLAGQAIDGNDEALAKECLQRKQDFSEQVTEQTQQLARYEPAMHELEDKIQGLKNKHKQMVQQIDMLAARSHLASAQEKAATTMGGIGRSSLTADFDKLEQQVSKQEARAQAAADRVTHDQGGDLEARVRALQTNSSLDDELAQLKRDRSQH